MTHNKKKIGGAHEKPFKGVNFFMKRILGLYRRYNILEHNMLYIKVIEAKWRALTLGIAEVQL